MGGNSNSSGTLPIIQERSQTVYKTYSAIYNVCFAIIVMRTATFSFIPLFISQEITLPSIESWLVFAEVQFKSSKEDNEDLNNEYDDVDIPVSTLLKFVALLIIIKVEMGNWKENSFTFALSRGGGWKIAFTSSIQEILSMSFFIPPHRYHWDSIKAQDPRERLYLLTK